MKFQFYSCATIDIRKDWQGKERPLSEVHFALFGREVHTNDAVAVVFRYCPYIILENPKHIESIRFSHKDTVEKTPLHGHTEQKITVNRLFIPQKREWERVLSEFKRTKGSELLDYHHTIQLQMMMEIGLKPLDIVIIDDLVLHTAVHERHTHTKREYHLNTRLVADMRKQFPVFIEKKTELCTFPTILSFDIEAYSENGAFPNPTNSHVFAICFSVQNTVDGTTIKDRKLIISSQSGSNYTIEAEYELLLDFYKELIDLDPDIITGWNINGFDWPYLLGRATRVGLSDFACLDKVRLHRVNMMRFKKSPLFLGRLNTDAMHLVKGYKEKISTNSNKPESYSLNYIARICLGSGKFDLTIPQMREHYKLGKIDIIAEYCLVDAQLPLQILQHEGILSLIFQIANISGASLADAFQMNTSHIVVAALSFACFEKGFVYNLPRPNKSGKFKGAFVFDPKPGLYRTLSILDFAALYPSIIISYNLCYTTLRRGNELDPSDTVIELPGDRKVNFTTKTRGLLPSTIVDYQKQRAAIKKTMKAHECKSTDYKRLDARQQAVKVISNSFYGILGASNFFGLQVIAEAVTAYGRCAIQKT